ncbi:hypothetical protein A2U01_0065747, partial [Trifolium medium]|nr:hypothetical protein [Trifolium medium]
GVWRVGGEAVEGFQHSSVRQMVLEDADR